ncbi:Copine-domain-containing protein [Zopfochytrium polystomum]|nr:Copine-domain-containing protein [Zopfochytrium polystomum]
MAGHPSSGAPPAGNAPPGAPGYGAAPGGYAPPPGAPASGYAPPPAAPPSGYTPPPVAPTGYAPPQSGYAPPPAGYAPAPAPPGQYAPPPTAAFGAMQIGGAPPNSAAPAGNQPSTGGTKVHLKVSCKGLVDRDPTSKSDPQLFIYVQHVAKQSKVRPMQRTESASSLLGDGSIDLRMTGFVPQVVGGWTLVGQSRPIKDDLDPVFPEDFAVDFHFEDVQNVIFVVVDVDHPGHAMAHQDYLGHTGASLAQLVATGSKGFTAPLIGDSKLLPDGVPKFERPPRGRRNQVSSSTITVSATAESDMRRKAFISLSVQKLEAKDANGKSDPYVVISRLERDAYNIERPVVVFKSPVIYKTTRPVWLRLKVPTKHLSIDGTGNDQLRVAIWDADLHSDDDLIGSFDTTLNQLVAAGSSRQHPPFPLINPKKAGRMFYKNSGQLTVDACTIEDEPTFLDFVAAGANISLSVAIDLTASNQPQRNPSSLHYMPQLVSGLQATQSHYPVLNEYQRALIGIGQVVQEYDNDKSVPVFGFGFAMNGARCPCSFFGNAVGVDGILKQYYDILMNPAVELYGPTDFAPVLREATQNLQKHLQAEPGRLVYHVLLIVTDGQITDMDATLSALASAASLPLSIIVVGVGAADFGMMRTLDGDGDGETGWRKRLAKPGGPPIRDIVQFVSMREVGGDPFALARETLREVPEQFLHYVQEKGIKLHK